MTAQIVYINSHETPVIDFDSCDHETDADELSRLLRPVYRWANVRAAARLQPIDYTPDLRGTLWQREAERGAASTTRVAVGFGPFIMQMHDYWPLSDLGVASGVIRAGVRAK